MTLIHEPCYLFHSFIHGRVLGNVTGINAYMKNVTDFQNGSQQLMNLVMKIFFEKVGSGWFENSSRGLECFGH